jgi:hypothetical protein
MAINLLYTCMPIMLPAPSSSPLLFSLPFPLSSLRSARPAPSSFFFFCVFLFFFLFWLAWYDIVRLIFLLVGLVCWGIFLGSVGCAAGDGESEKRREAGRCWVCCSRSKWRELIAVMDEGSLGPKILVKLEKEEDEVSHCWCTYAGVGIFEVECVGR